VNKLIFSRKGFDSKYGGIPSTWAEDGELVSFPIPSTGKLDDGIAPDATRYDAITGGGTTLDARRRALAPGRGFDDHCHHDPDLVEGSRPRNAGAAWRATLGQADAAESHLASRVAVGDIFLFFGWFRRSQRGDDGGLAYVRDEPSKHVIFGYLEIGEIIPLGRGAACPPWLEGHAHARTHRRDLARNTVYVAADRLTMASSRPGAGVFHHSPELELTAPGKSRSRWALPDLFRGRPFSYHPNPWREGYFQSAAIGQEFVVDADDSVRRWVLDRIVAGTPRA
jgi:hypothetical protein